MYFHWRIVRRINNKTLYQPACCEESALNCAAAEGGIVENFCELTGKWVENSRQATDCKCAESVAAMVRDRARIGLSKYGVTVERNTLELVEWIQHLQEELLDAAVYLERIKSDLSKSR